MTHIRNGAEQRQTIDYRHKVLGAQSYHQNLYRASTITHIESRMGADPKQPHTIRDLKDEHELSPKVIQSINQRVDRIEGEPQQSPGYGLKSKHEFSPSVIQHNYHVIYV